MMLAIVLAAVVSFIPVKKPPELHTLTAFGVPASAGCQLGFYKSDEHGLPTGAELSGGTHKEIWTVKRHDFWSIFFPTQQVEYLVTNRKPQEGEWLAYRCE